MPSSCKPEKEAFNRTVSHSRQSKKDHPLLEDWPTSKRRDIRKRVTFAQYSEIRLFANSLYRSRKAYSSNDIEVMKAQGYVEARKIYDLISRFPVQTGTAIQSILGLGLLSPEQLVGLEHLVTPKVAKDHVKGRRSHSALVLRAQEILHEKKVPSEDSFSYLAKVASASSSKHVKKAKIRASISLRAEEFDPRSNIRGRRFRSKTGSGSESVSSTSKGWSSNSRDLDVDFPAKTVTAPPSRTKEQVTSANDPKRERQLSSSLRSSCPSKSFQPKDLEKQTTKMDSDVDASPKIAIGPPSVAQLSQVPNPSSLKHTEKIDPEIHEGGRSLRTRLGLLSLSSTPKASSSNYLELLLEKKTNEIHVHLPKITDTPTRIVEKNLGHSGKIDDSTPSFAIVMSRKALIKSTFAHAA